MADQLKKYAPRPRILTRARRPRYGRSGGVAEIEQPVDLRHVPAESARELGLLDALLHHGLIDAQLSAFQGTGAHGVFLAPLAENSMGALAPEKLFDLLDRANPLFVHADDHPQDDQPTPLSPSASSRFRLIPGWKYTSFRLAPHWIRQLLFDSADA